MLAPASSTYFSWLLNIYNFIRVNVLDAVDKILRGYYRLNNIYS